MKTVPSPRDRDRLGPWQSSTSALSPPFDESPPLPYDCSPPQCAPPAYTEVFDDPLPIPDFGDEEMDGEVMMDFMPQKPSLGMLVDESPGYVDAVEIVLEEDMRVGAGMTGLGIGGF